MKILQMVPALRSGGVETGTVDIAKALKKLGHEVLVMSSGGDLVKELVKAGIQHLTYPIHVKSLATLSLIKTLTDLIRRERIDIVHARSRVPAWIGYLATRGEDCAFVTTCHGYYSEHFFSRVMGWAKEVIVISHLIGRHMIDHFGVPPERIHLIHRGVDLSRFPFHADRYNSGYRDSKFVVTNIGRLSPIKGHRHFIKAVLVAQQQIPGLEGWIVGAPESGKEDYLGELKDLVKKLGLEDRIKFFGRRSDIPEILAGTDVLTLTTNVAEGFGRVLIEAGAAGTAVVSTRAGGVLEIVEDGKNGLLVGVDDEKDLARAWQDLYENPAKAKTLAQAMRAKVEAEFSLDAMVQKTVQVYNKAVSQKRILITKLGSLGDLILAVPSFRMLRKKYPQARITLVVDNRWYGIARQCPYLDDVWTFDRSKKKGRWARILKLAEMLRKERYDFSVDLQNNSKTHLLARLAGIPRRLGHGKGWTSFLLTQRPPQPQKVGLAPVEHQFEVLKLAGVNEQDDRLELWVKDDDRVKIEALLEEAWVNETQRLIGFSLSASAAWPSKNWPVERFIDLARELGAKLNARIFLLGDGTAAPLGEMFDRQALPNVTNLVGKTSLQELAALISRLDALVSGDSAPMHIAAAFGVPFVALFGPTDPKRHLPPARKFNVFYKPIPCSPCYSGNCKAREFACLPSIGVGEVYQSIRGLLAAEKDAVPVA